MKGKSIFISGATGFIGGYIVEEALRNGYEIFVAFREQSNLQYIDTSKVKLIRFDFENVDGMVVVFQKYSFNYIIHCAGLTRHPKYDELHKINTIYLANLVKAIEISKLSLNKFVHLSSLAAFGPAEYTKGGIINQESQPQPITNYGRTKLEGESILNNTTLLPYLIFRPSIVYGPRDKDLLTVFITVGNGLQVYIGQGNQVLTFIYVKDLASLVVSSLTYTVVRKSYFLTDGNKYSSKVLQQKIAFYLKQKTIKINLPISLFTVIAYATEYVAKVFGKYPVLNIDKLNEIKAQSWNCDVGPTFKEFGYVPKWNLDEGLKETIDWYLKNDWL